MAPAVSGGASPMTDARLETALRLRQAGRLAEAADIYRQILEHDPRSFEALHALGLVRYQTGQLEEAERLIGKAIDVNPGAPDALYNRACLLVKLNRPEDALLSFDAAISLKPDYVEALANRGGLLARLNRNASALASFEAASALRPTLAELWLSRAAALFALGRFEQAILCCDRALALKPALAEAATLRNQVLARQRAQLPANSRRPSLHAFERELAHGRVQNAFQIALEILHAIDNGFGRLNGVDFDEAPSDGSEEHVARRFCARFAAGLAKLLLDTELKLSPPEYERLLLFHRWIDIVVSLAELGSGDPCEHATLMPRLALRSLNSEIGIDLDAVWQKDSKAAACAFLRYSSSPYIFRPRAFDLRERLLEWLPARLGSVTLSPLTLSRIADVYMHCSYAVAPRKHAIKRELMRQMRRALLDAGCREISPDAPASAEGRQTIVVVAENLRPGHSVHRTHSRAIASLRGRFHVVGLVHPNPKGTAIESLFDECVDMEGAEFFENVCYLANQILIRKPSLVFYLGVGMTPLVLGLASLRLAPIQCVSFGHTATTMSEAMDYFVLPEDFVASKEVFSERLLMLPKSAMPFAPRPFPAPQERARRADSSIRIAVPGSTMKLNPKVFDAVADIMARAKTPIEVHFFPLGGVGLVHAELARAIGERIKGAIVFPELPHETYMQRLSECDLFLSPFPYGNMNSILDCFQLGLPGVCLDGAEAHAHADGAFFARIGLPPELTAETLETYVGAAVRLVDDKTWRSQCQGIVLNADLDAAFFAGDARQFCDALAGLISQGRGSAAQTKARS